MHFNLLRQSAQDPCPRTREIFKNKSRDLSDFLLKVNRIFFFFTHTHYTLFSRSLFFHLRPLIAKARRGGRRGKVTAVITDDMVVVTDDIVFLIERD